MSSGNPFRTSLSLPHNPAASSPVPQTSFISADSSVPEAREDGRSGLEDAFAPPPRTKKHVRIESNTTFIPPHPATYDGDSSPNDSFSPRLGQAQNAGFPPYTSPSSSSYMSAGELHAPSTRQRSDMAVPDVFASPRRPDSAPQSAISPSGVPANPFSRTLASLEPQQEKGTAEGTEKSASATNRVSLDVESFKNLLMTGKAGPRQSGQAPQVPAPSTVPQFESSSSTDTSSISRQSLFESTQGAHVESPRTSYGTAESDEEESQAAMAEVKKAKKKPPPAPKHRHGKPVVPRQPQVVSFDDFAASEPSISPVTRPRENSDSNKPLPPIPAASSPPLQVSTQDISTQQQKPVEQQSRESPATSEAPQPQKRAPPPVPLARRQSQLRSSNAGNRSRSNSSLTMSSQISIEAPLHSPVPSNKDPLAQNKSPPPPPRSRHGARLTEGSFQSANSSTTELPSRSPSVRTNASAQLDPYRNNQDSEYLPSTSSDIRRTSSTSSRRIVSNESATSVASTSMPPPPPPRRRNRSSLDQQRPTLPASSPTSSRRTSTEQPRASLDSKRRTSAASESSLRNEYASVNEKKSNEHALYSPNQESENRLGVPSAGAVESPRDEGTSTSTEQQQRSDSSNILDDMEKFQREIDELRSRFKQAG